MASALLALLALLALSSGLVASYPSDSHEDSIMHPHIEGNPYRAASEDQLTAEYWQKQARSRLRELLRQDLNTNKAKNVIFFVGDGMSIPTLTAARMYAGQLSGESGEETQLSFEKFPITGLSKTYCVNKQVADSACSATAYLTGVKANSGTLGVTAKVTKGNCTLMQDTDNHVHSIAKAFVDDGRSAGIVTTTRVTHASPAGAYAHTSHRDWENDDDITKAGFDPSLCPDIAHQLVHGDPGRHFKVILGGGRREFLPKKVIDEEGEKGKRSDKRNLIEEWKINKDMANETYEYTWNRRQLLNLKESTQNILGLFESSHCRYNLETDNATEPTLEEMVQTAIKVLSKNKKGYFLFAEGGRIDHAHHSSYARIALDETVEFHKAVAKAVEMTSTMDTLIVVSSDHAHTMSISGYPTRGNDILGTMDTTMAGDGLPFLTLSYANGKGYRPEVDGKRVNISIENISDIKFRYPATVPLDTETHGGDDVAVFALGPWQHLFSGMYEQNAIPHIMSYASCVDESLSACSTASPLQIAFTLALVTNLVVFMVA